MLGDGQDMIVAFTRAVPRTGTNGKVHRCS